MIIALFILLIFLSRIFFINSDPVFFDSPEYLARLADKNFLNAITSGHLPLHAGYIFIFWPIYQVAQSLGANPSLFVIIGQIFFALLALYSFYLFIKIISDKTTAFYSTIFASLLPLFWITNVTIMMETTYLFFFILSLYFLAKYSKSQGGTNHQYYLVLSVFSFALSALTHLGVIIWIPFLLYTSFYLSKKGFYRYALFLIAALVIFTIVNAAFIAFPQNKSLTEGAISLYTAKLGERAQFNFDLKSILIYARNFLIPLFRNFAILVVILGFLSLIKLYFSNKKLFFLCFLWTIPSFIANQWWDSVLFGRHALIAGFGFAFLVSNFVKNSKPAILVIIIYLFITAFPAIYLLKKEIPYLQLASTAGKLPKDGLYIESHFVRPQVNGKYDGKTIYVDEPGFQKEKLKDEINFYLDDKKPIFISSQALSEPYGLYSGPYLHALSLSYRNEFVLRPIIEERFSLKEYSVINRKDNLMIYQITSDKPSPYPHVKNIKEHRRRLDYSDPLLFLYNKLKLFWAF